MHTSLFFVFTSKECLFLHNGNEKIRDQLELKAAVGASVFALTGQGKLHSLIAVSASTSVLHLYLKKINTGTLLVTVATTSLTCQKIHESNCYYNLFSAHELALVGPLAYSLRKRCNVVTCIAALHGFFTNRALQASY